MKVFVIYDDCGQEEMKRRLCGVREEGEGHDNRAKWS